MQRLFRISFNQFIFSFTPILVWFVIGIIVDPKLVNVFSVTYPMQFVYLILLAMFGTGPNINETKDHKKGAAFSGFLMGAMIGGIIFLLVILNLDHYLSFMNVEYDSYKEFALFSLISLYVSLIFGMLMEKLYFTQKEKQANKFMVIFNLIYAVSLIGTSLLSNDKTLVVVVSLMCLTVFVFYTGIKTFSNFRFKLNVHFYKWFRYESYEIMADIMMFLIYLFGLSHSNSYGVEYMVAINFNALITDTQWDSFGEICTVAKIDISKNKFNYKNSLRNSYKLLAVLMFTSFLMLVVTLPFYQIDMSIFLVYLVVELCYFVVYPFIALKSSYLQIEYSPFKTTFNGLIGFVLRFLANFINTPFCLCIGEMACAIYELIAYGIMFRKIPKKQIEK